MEIKHRILILGVTGMLGHTLFVQLSRQINFEVHATARTTDGLSGWFGPELVAKITGNREVENFGSVLNVIEKVRPDVIINCIGIIKQSPAAHDPVISITVNALFPHQLSAACKASGVRLIHISTDCVFDGTRGGYTESDISNATDLYGRTKYLGEVTDAHCVTLRTSMIGHELKEKRGLIEWFLSQDRKIRGFTHVIFSGLPTVEIARIIDTFVIPNRELRGLYHISAAPISKYDLLRLVAERYGKRIEIDLADEPFLDRSLNSGLFQRVTGYKAPSWSELIDEMHKHFIDSPCLKRTTNERGNVA